jgi:DNA-binding CsgD family transcriptional regulator/PAS domain-containing protein
LQKRLEFGEKIWDDLFKPELYPQNWQTWLLALVQTARGLKAALLWAQSRSDPVNTVAVGLGVKQRETLLDSFRSGRLDVRRSEGPANVLIEKIGDVLPGFLVIYCRASNATLLTEFHEAVAARRVDLSRALSLAAATACRRKAAERLGALLNVHTAPVVIVNREGIPLLANEAGYKALSGGGALRLGRDGALWLGNDKEAVRRILTGEVRSAMGSGANSPIVLAAGTQQKRRQWLTIVPLQAPGDRGYGQEYMVCLRTEDPDAAPAPEVIQAAFNLTPSEAQITAALARGMSIAEYAAHKNLKESTARWHLKNALEKSRCRTYTELIRLVYLLQRW